MATRGLPRRIGLVPATTLVIASMIGVGVFTTTGFLLRDLGSPLAVLSAWALGGVLALCGALSYAELGAALPQNGGEYQLLSRIYHPVAGFIAGWISFVVGFSAPLAAVAIAFGQYASRLLPGVHPTPLAIIAIVSLAALHMSRVSLGSIVQSVITFVEVALIAVFIVGGLRSGVPQHLGDTQNAPLVRTLLSPAFGAALVYVSFAYSGWNAAAYVAGEVENPGRTVPRALVLGTSLVAVLYVGINAVLLMSAPAGELEGVVEIGYVGAVRLFGPGAGKVLSVIMTLCLFASIGAQIVAGARVYEAMGRDYAALRIFARRGPQTGPIVGIGLQAAVAIVMVLTASFDALLTYVGFTLSLSALLTVCGLFVLRVREPTLPRPYRTAGYPMTPLLAICILLWMAVHAIWQRPVASLTGLGTILIGAALFTVVRDGNGGSREQGTP